MSNSICLTGRAFSLTGAATFNGEQVNFALTFNNSQDQATVEAFEWYLDGILIINQNHVSFSGNVVCGGHTIGARILSAGGWSGIQSTTFSTCTGTAGYALSGPSDVNEGATATFQIIKTFSDNTTIDVTSDFTLTCPDGVFVGGVFTASLNNTIGDTRFGTITGISSYLEIQTDIVIVDTSASHASVAMAGSATVYGGSSATFQAIATFPDNSTQDITGQYLFTCPDGTFDGGILTIPNNSTGGNLQSEITAADANIPEFGQIIALPTLNKAITIVENTDTVDVLVVDVLHNISLNIVGLISNPEVTENGVPAYKGNNIVPVGATPVHGLIAASDGVPWRFQFSIFNLIQQYPNSTAFTFYINGRGSVPTTLTVVYGLHTSSPAMGLTGYTGMLEPTAFSYPQGSTTVYCPVGAGANGSYAETDLPEIIKFVYNVAGNSITYSIPAPVTYPVPVNIIALNDFDFMSVAFSWNQGGTRLSFFVGFENSGIPFDNQYTGNTAAQPTIPTGVDPALAASLWFGGVPADTSGETQEEVLISIKQIIHNFPNSQDTISLGIYAVWTTLTENSTFGVQFTTYSGGGMALSGTSFTNTGGTQNSDNNVQVPSTLFFAYHDNTPPPQGKVGIITYTKSTGLGTIQIFI